MMFSSLFALPSSISTSSSSVSSTTTKILRADQTQSFEEEIPLKSKEKIGKELASILTHVQQNQTKRLNLTSTSLGHFYDIAHTLSRHKNTVRSLIVLPNGQLASGSDDKTIKLWDLRSNSCFSTLQGHTSWVDALAILPNSRLASGSGDNTIKLWDLNSNSCSSTLQGHASWVDALAVLPNGLLASGSFDRTIKLWDLDSRSYIATLRGHTGYVLALAILPNGGLASSSADNTIKLWDLASHSCLATLRGHSDTVRALAVLPNGLLASGSWDHTIKLWDLASHSCLTTLRGHTGSVLALAVLPNGRLASSSADNTIKLWNVASHSCLSTIQGHTESVYALAVLPDGLLASGSDDNTIKLWEPKTLSTKQLSSILSALKNNVSVTDLDLSHNPNIQDDIIDPLIKIFKKSWFFSFFCSKPNATLQTIDLRKTEVSKKGVKKLEKAIQHERLSIEVLADCPIEWMMIYFLIIFCRANRNSPFADSGLDLCKHGEIGPFLGVPSSFFARPRKNPFSNAKHVTPSPS